MSRYEAEETIRLIRGEPAQESNDTRVLSHVTESRLEPAQAPVVGATGESRPRRPVIVLLDEDERIMVASSDTGKETEQEKAEDWICQPCSPPVVVQSHPQPALEKESETKLEPEPTTEAEPQLRPADEWSCQPCTPPK